MKKATPPAKRQGQGTETVRVTQDEVAAMLATMTPAPRKKAEVWLEKTYDSDKWPSVRLASKGDVLDISYNHENRNAASILAMADMGTNDHDLYWGLMGQIANIGSHGNRIDEGNSNFLLSVVRAVQPRDGLEALLAVQMGAIHAATMMLAKRLNHVANLPQQDAAERALNKLARTYAMQMEALKRYRSKGEQRVIVERVTVNKGGQAIVGTVTHGGEGAA
jgi:hypothetical protein